MKTSPLAAFALTALAAASAIPYSSPVRAGTTIQHCQGSDGVSIYTDQDCSAIGARELPLSGHLLSRLAAQDMTRADAVSGNALTHLAAAPARRSPASGCARSPTQLAMDLEGAFALDDVNRIAESYHWVGLSADQGNRIMARLDRLDQKPLLQASHLDAFIGSGHMQLASANAGFAGSGGMMQLMFDEGGAASSVLDFDVRRYHGCYFIEF